MRKTRVSLGAGEDLQAFIYATLNTSCPQCNSSPGAPVVEVVTMGDDYAHLSSASAYFAKRLLSVPSSTVGDSFQAQMPVKLSLSMQADAIPSNGLVWFWTLDDNLGYRYGPYPNWNTTALKELISGSICTPVISTGSLATNWRWRNGGIELNQSTGSNPDGTGQWTRCVTDRNFPVSGKNPRTVITVFKPSTLASSPTLWATAGDYTAGAVYDQLVTNLGAILTCHSAGCVSSANSKVSAGSWYVFGSTYIGGTSTTATGGTTMYLNGARVCGFTSPTTTDCGSGSATVINSTAQPVTFGTYGNQVAAGPCNAPTGGCNFQQSFAGTIAAMVVYNRAVPAGEMTMICRGLQKYMALPPRNIALTCN
jgi:hypothetical protein